MKRKQYSLMLALALIAGLIGGFISSQVIQPVFAGKPRVIEANAFRVVNENGRTLGEFTTLSDDGVQLRMLTKALKSEVGFYLIASEGEGSGAVHGTRCGHAPDRDRSRVFFHDLAGPGGASPGRAVGLASRDRDWLCGRSAGGSSVEPWDPVHRQAAIGLQRCFRGYADRWQVQSGRTIGPLGSGGGDSGVLVPPDVGRRGPWRAGLLRFGRLRAPSAISLAEAVRRRHQSS